MGLTHGANERVVFLEGSEALVPIDPVRLGTEYSYKVVTTNQDLADAAVNLFTWHGGTVRPLSPVGVRGSRNAAGDLLIEWTRRSRAGAGLKPFSDVPLAEEREVYEVEIYDGSTVKRTLNTIIQHGDGSAAGWQVASGTGITSDSQGSVTFTNQSSDAIAYSQPISGDFVAEVGARPDNTNIPANLYIVPAAHLLDGAGPRLYISRSTGMDNSAITITDGVNVLTGTDDTDATAPARFFIVRKGSVISVYRNTYFPTSTPFYISSQIHVDTVYLAADNGGNIAETAAKTAYRCRIFHNDVRRFVVYRAVHQGVDFGSTQSSIKVRVYQVSGTVGRGAYWEATL